MYKNGDKENDKQCRQHNDYDSSYEFTFFLNIQNNI